MIPFIFYLGLLLLPVPAWASANWPNEPSSAVEVYDCAFSNSLCGAWNAYNTQVYASPGGSPTPLSPPTAFHTYMAAGSTTGNGQWGVTLQNIREMYVGVWLNIGSQTMGNSNGTNKLLFARNPAEDNNFLVWQGCSGCAKTLKWYFQVNYDVCYGCPGIHGSCRLSCGDGTGWAEPNTADASRATISAGSGWHKIEWYIKTSLGYASHDGILKIWVDGYLTTNYSGLNITPSGINDFQINHTWDGFNTADRDLSKTWEYFWDHIHISVPNCPLGCGGGGPTAPPPPPPQPPPQPIPPTGGNYVWQSQFSGTQGTGQFSYRDTVGNLLTYNSSQAVWNGNQTYLTIWGNGFHPGTTSGAVVRWTAHENGTAHITGAAQKANLSCGDGIEFRIKDNGGSNLFSKDITASDGTAYPYDISYPMTTGQVVDFVVRAGASNDNSCDSTFLNPTIAWGPTTPTSPTISGFTPTSGGPGTSVVITGTNFSPSLTGNGVTFGGAAAQITAASATSITAQVPATAVTGTVKVTTTAGTGTSGGTFTVPLSGSVETVNNLSGAATGTSSVSLTFTTVPDGTGNAAKYDIRMAQETIAWADASSVASGTCSTPYNPGTQNQTATCTVTGLTTGAEYQFQLVSYRGTLNVDAVFGNLSNVATVTTRGTILDVPVICMNETEACDVQVSLVK